MSIFDVRNSNTEEITKIVFSDLEWGHSDQYVPVATRIEVNENYLGMCDIFDGCEDYIRIADKEHAQNLIKALNKAIELGWLK